jgi:hypothetical protein
MSRPDIGMLSMSIGKKFSSRSALLLQSHMSATASRPSAIGQPVPAGTKPPQGTGASLGPATYYRLGVAVPGGPVKRIRGD